MAFPKTRIHDFVDDSTPYVDADFLNRIQDAAIDLYSTRYTVRREDWGYDPAENPGGFGRYENGQYLPDHRWVAVGSNDGGVSAADPTANFPWPHLLVAADGANGGSGGFRSAAKVLRVDPDLMLLLEGSVQRLNLGGANWAFSWGLSGVTFTVDLASGKWKCMTDDGAGNQWTLTVPFPVNTTARADLRIEVYGANRPGGQRAIFYVGGVAVATHATHIPTGGGLYVASSVSYNPIDTASWRVGPLSYGFAS